MPSAVWNPQVERRPHPLGEMGVRSSLEEVARRAAAGGSHPRVRSWAIEQIHAARQAGRNVKGDRARAEILLQTIQRTKTWVPDPVNAEYIPGAHLLACNKDDADGVCLKGDDCDGLAVLLGACCLSVGLHAMIVGHGYNQARNIQHVLCAIRVNGTWLYADPSYDFPLGHCEPFRRERLLSIPNVKVLCDANQCIVDGGANINPDRDGFVTEGIFIGVNGIEWLGQSATTAQDAIANAAEQGAQQEANRQAATGKIDAKKVAQAAGAAGAAAACAVVGAAAASPICAALGSSVTGTIIKLATGGTYDSFVPWSAARPFTCVSRDRFLQVAKIEIMRARDFGPFSWTQAEAAAKSTYDAMRNVCKAQGESAECGPCMKEQQQKKLQQLKMEQIANELLKKLPPEEQGRILNNQRHPTAAPSGSRVVKGVAIAAAAGGLLWWLLA